MRTERKWMHIDRDDEVADAPLGPPTDLVLGALEFLPTTGVFGAAALEPSDLPELLASLPLEAANTASGDDEGLAGVRGHGGEVNFPRSTVACTVPGASCARGTSIRALSIQSPDSRRACRPRSSLGDRGAKREMGGLCPSARRRGPAPCGRPGRATSP
jgi:hypothetical protein